MQIYFAHQNLKSSSQDEPRPSEVNDDDSLAQGLHDPYLLNQEPALHDFNLNHLK